MYSVIVGCSPQTGHSGRGGLTSLNVAASASYEEQAADQRVADAEHELQRLGRLERADDARQDAEHAASAARRRELRRRRLGEEAAVAGALLGLEDRELALEAEDRAVDDGDPRARRRRRSGGSASGSCRRRRRSRPSLVEDPVDVLRRQRARGSFTTSRRGSGPGSRASPQSTFGVPSVSSEWMIWRWRFDSSTTSASRSRSCRRRPRRDRARSGSRDRPRRAAGPARRAASLALVADLGDQQVCRE